METQMIETLMDLVRNRFFGKYRGTVSDNADTTSRGRLKVKVPALLGDLEVWAMPCVPYAGNMVGLYCLPESGTGVWVEFEGGDLSYPIWTGFYWGDNELPDQNDAAVKILKTQKISLRIDDTADECVLKNSSECTLTMAQDVQTACQQAKHTVASSGLTSELTPAKQEITSSGVKISGPTVNINDGALEVTK